MIHSRFSLLVAAAAMAAVGPSCSSGFGKVPGQRRLVVELQDGSTVGSPDQPLPLAINTPVPLRVVVRALDENGVEDTSFEGYVRLSAKPGAIEPLEGPDAQGRNIKLGQGVSRPVDVRLVNGYGPTVVLADDIGYAPADPLGQPPPGCSNGVDDDGDGAIDFPADEGCAFANDDDEGGGTFAQGASRPIYFALPRVADIRGVTTGGGATPYPKEQIQVDTGYRQRRNAAGEIEPIFEFDLVVSRIASDGFYVTDPQDPRGRLNSIFSFNFNPPPRMRVCDRMKTFGGTANEFFGFTQIAYPTWTLDEWDPRARTCRLPDARLLSPAELGDPDFLLGLSGTLVRAQTTPNRAFIVKVTPKLGPADVPKGEGDTFVPAPDATNCDFNRDGNIDFTLGHPEQRCAATCTADPECTEYSNYAARRSFRLTLEDATKQKVAIQADASTSPSFDPIAMRGQELRSFSGTLHYFSGGSQFTIEARCADDIVVDLAGTPLGTDKTCAADTECPQGYTCAQLTGGERACRSQVGAPPPLACVAPRTFLDNNPQ